MYPFNRELKKNKWESTILEASDNATKSSQNLSTWRRFTTASQKISALWYVQSWRLTDVSIWSPSPSALSQPFFPTFRHSSFKKSLSSSRAKPLTRTTLTCSSWWAFLLRVNSFLTFCRSTCYTTRSWSGPRAQTTWSRWSTRSNWDFRKLLIKNLVKEKSSISCKWTQSNCSGYVRRWVTFSKSL